MSQLDPISRHRAQRKSIGPLGAPKRKRARLDGPAHPRPSSPSHPSGRSVPWFGGGSARSSPPSRDPPYRRPAWGQDRPPLLRSRCPLRPRINGCCCCTRTYCLSSSLGTTTVACSSGRDGRIVPSGFSRFLASLGLVHCLDPAWMFFRFAAFPPLARPERQPRQTKPSTFAPARNSRPSGLLID